MNHDDESIIHGNGSLSPLDSGSDSDSDSQQALLVSLQLQLEQLTLENKRLLNENSRLLAAQEQHLQQQSLFQNRVNEAKKRETHKALIATQLENQVQQLQLQLDELSKERVHTMQQKDTLQHSLAAIQQTCLEKLQAAEEAFREQVALNEERREKFILFTEAKAQELRQAHKNIEQIRLEFVQSQEALTSVRQKLHEVTTTYQQDQIRIRELAKENQKLKKNAMQLSQMGDSLEYKLHQTTQESEEHKTKRSEARHELMTLLRKLEAEQAVTENLKDVLTLSILPKAKSQQQLLKDCIQDMEKALLVLGRTIDPVVRKIDSDRIEIQQQQKQKEEDTILPSGKQKKIFAKDIGSMISNVEHETQFVSRGILKMIQLVEKLHSFIQESPREDRTCITSIALLLQQATATFHHGTRVVEHTRILSNSLHRSANTTGDDEEYEESYK